MPKHNSLHTPIKGLQNCSENNTENLSTAVSTAKKGPRRSLAEPLNKIRPYVLPGKELSVINEDTNQPINITRTEIPSTPIPKVKDEDPSLKVQIRENIPIQK